MTNGNGGLRPFYPAERNSEHRMAALNFLNFTPAAGGAERRMASLNFLNFTPGARLHRLASSL